MAIPEGKSIAIDHSKLSIRAHVAMESIQQAFETTGRPSSTDLYIFLRATLLPKPNEEPDDNAWTEEEVDALTYDDIGEIFKGLEKQKAATVPNSNGSASKPRSSTAARSRSKR